MSSLPDDSGPFATYARNYASKGYEVFPLPLGEKSPPPRGVTGAAGKPADDELLNEWVEFEGAGNIGIRASDGFLVLDVDHHDQKLGGHTIESMVGRLGPLPPTFHVTSRNAGTPHGHFYYQVPKGRAWKSSLGPDVEVIHPRHRYVVAPGSIVEGRTYMGYGADLLPLAMPTVSDFAPLPDAWVEELSASIVIDGMVAVRDLSIDADSWQEMCRPGPPSSAVKRAVAKYVASPSVAGSAYDTVVGVSARLVLLAQQNEPGVVEALQVVKGLYSDLRGGERNAAAEFDRALMGAVQKFGDVEWLRFMREHDWVYPKLEIVGASQYESTLGLVGREHVESSWSPVDLRPYLDGTISKPRPTFGVRVDGAAMLYPERLNVVFGEPESGKSWVMFAILAERLLKGETVGLIDYEDAPEGAIARLRLLGVPDGVLATRLRYAHPDVRSTPAGVRALVDGCTVVGIDATTEALSTEDLGSNSDVEVAAFYARLPKFICSLGCTALLIDHVTKAWDGQNQQTGSQHKRAGVDGVSIKVENVVPFVPGGAGLSRLVVTKDRNGGVREEALAPRKSRGAHFADFRLLEDGGWEFDMPFPVPERSPEDREADKAIALKIAITAAAELTGRPMKSLNKVAELLRAQGVKFTASMLSKRLLDELVPDYLTPDYAFVQHFGVPTVGESNG